MNTVTSTTCSKLLPAAARISFRLRRPDAPAFQYRLGDPSGRLPTWPETNRKPLERMAGE
jgi:hypothetical protein